MEAGASIRQFQRRLERAQRLRRMREVTRTIAEAQAAGTGTTLHEELRTLYGEGKAVYEIVTGGVAQSLEHGPRNPQGVEPNE
jgi:hypothetical protein